MSVKNSSVRPANEPPFQSLHAANFDDLRGDETALLNSQTCSFSWHFL